MEYIALGNFDGMHLGHQELLNEVVSMARKDGATPAVCIFEPHPMKLVQPEHAPKLLTSLSLRKKLFLSIGIEEIHVIKFNENILNMNGINFLDNLRKEYNAKLFAVGYNFTFGEKGAWNSSDIKAYCDKNNMQSVVLKKFISYGEEVSSTIIRGHIQKGELSQACKLLGRPHLIEGKVVEGNKIGRNINFPTANFIYELDYCYPPHAVYFTISMIDKKWYYSITNIGPKPTVDKEIINVETHILNYSGDLYGKSIQIGFLKKIRNQKKFANVEELKTQLIKDENKAKEWIENYEDVFKVCNKATYTL